MCTYEGKYYIGQRVYAVLFNYGQYCVFDVEVLGVEFTRGGESYLIKVADDIADDCWMKRARSSELYDDREDAEKSCEYLNRED